MRSTPKLFGLSRNGICKLQLVEQRFTYKRKVQYGKMYQSFTMGQPRQLVIAGLLACLALANALPGLFSRENIVTYKYDADLKTGTIEPAPFASQFMLSGFMHIQPELSDPNLKNAYQIALNVTHGIRNGEIKHFEKIVGSTLPVPDAAMELNDPFLIVFDDVGKVKSLMVNEEEAEWSRNMKRSIASMLQLDLASIKLNTPVQPHSFITKENTIYGECSVAYDVHRTPGLGDEDFTVTKIMVPMNCQNFSQYIFNLQESEGCLIEEQEEMTSASRRVFHIKYSNEDFLIKSLVAHGVINYFPWNFNSEAHYVLANQSMEFAYMLPADAKTDLPPLDIKKMVTLDDVTYQKYQTPYTDFAGPNLFENFNSTDEILFDDLNQMLHEVWDYMNENHLEMIPPEMENGQMINRIMNAMSYMNLSKLHKFFDQISEDDDRFRSVFLKIIPYVGTSATCLFVRDIMFDSRVSVTQANTLLIALPSYIRMPTTELLISMEKIMDLPTDKKNIRNAGILSFATMIYKTYKYESNRGKMNQELLDKYVKHYYDRVINEPIYEMRMVYLHAMKNMEIGGVKKILEPIIRGELNVSENPESLRLHAMLVNYKATDDFEYIHNLYWPILANTNEPLPLRICAYTILIQQPPRMERMMNLYWFMVYEKNEHLYNYHYTTLKNLAYTSNSCLRPMTEIARKIFRFTRLRSVSGIRTGSWLFDYENKEFGFGKSVNLMVAADELTGTPYCGMMQFTTMKRRKMVNSYEVWLRVEGRDRNFEQILENIVIDGKNLRIEKIQAILEKASKDMPSEKPSLIEFVLMKQGRTVFAISDHTSRYLDTFTHYWAILTTIHHQFRDHIYFTELYTMQVPNDFGLPTLLHNNIPHVVSVMANTEPFNPTSFSGGIELVVRHWNHGHQLMGVYNPMINTWHAIRRVSAFDMSLPIEINYTFNKTANSLKLSSKRLPATNYSDAGLRSHFQNYVMVIGEDKNLLKEHCLSCQPAELVTQGEKYRKTTELMNFDSEDAALHFSFHQYDCEKISSPNPHFDSSADIINRISKTTWGNNEYSKSMGLSDYAALLFVGPKLGSCGYLMKLEPSIVYPASSIDIKLSWGVEGSYENNLRQLSAKILDVQGTLQVNSITSGTSSLRWTMKGTLDTNEGHFKTQLNVQIMRKMPGKNNLQFCIKGHKTYPKINIDPLEIVNMTHYKSIGKLVMTMGETDGSDCVHNDTSVTINIEGEMSDEQEKALVDLKINGECQKDIKDNRYPYIEDSIGPRTPACLREAILRSNLRKFSYTVAYERIPEYLVPKLQWISDIIRADLMPYATYLSAHTEPGVIKILVENPLDDQLLNIGVRTPTHAINYTGISKDDHYAWAMGLDNVQFSQSFVNQVKDGEIKFCAMYPKVFMNTDGAIVPFDLPNKWTLLTGDYTQYKFSVLAKRFQHRKFGLLVSFGNHTIEVLPSDTTPDISLDGELVDYETDVTLSSTPQTMHMSWKSYTHVLELKHESFYLEWSDNFVFLGMSTDLQGQVTGLCGHLDGSHAQRMARLYTLED